jgi:aminoglycoside phosphotransferase family enzyme
MMHHRESDERLVQIDDKVAFLRRPESYPVPTSHVDCIATHMACVFLANGYAYKLKKPVRHDHLDFTTIEARQIDCTFELQLNRRLAPDVYEDIVPLVIGPDRALRLDAEGTVVDWLVKMRRLPAEKMLDYAILHGTANEPELRSVARILAKFYRSSPPVEMTPEKYCQRLSAGIRNNLQGLMSAPFGLSCKRIGAIADALLAFVQQEPDVVGRRAVEGRIIDAHGDLRPEHICLEDPPVVIDCLEFSRDLRVLDTASELSFLTLECDRLDGAAASRVIWDEYIKQTGDSPEDRLRQFYRGCHALTRCRLAIWHLKDEVVDRPNHWSEKAAGYLDLAAEAARVP